MAQTRPFLAALITLMLFTGCSPDAALNTYPEFGKSLVAELQARNFEAVEAKLDLALKRTTTRAKLLEMAQVLPATAPTSVRVAQLHVMSTWQLAGSEPRRVWLALQYQFTDTWVLATFVWRENERGFQAIDGFQITPLPASLETINRFTLVDKGLTHHVVLGLAVALPLFTVFGLVLCLTTSMPWRRKTLWALAILFGVTVLRFNWTNGVVVDWQPLSFQLFSAGYAHPELGPPMISLALPLGAIIFLSRHGWTRFAGDPQPT